MNLYEIEKAVSDYLATNWTYTPIRRINTEDPSQIPFIECYFKPGLMSAIEIKGAGARFGVFWINIYTAKGVGTQQGNSYGGTLEGLFNHKKIGDVVCQSDFVLPYTEYVGIDEPLQACHHKTIIPFSVITEL